MPERHAIEPFVAGEPGPVIVGDIFLDRPLSATILAINIVLLARVLIPDGIKARLGRFRRGAGA